MPSLTLLIFLLLGAITMHPNFTKNQPLPAKADEFILTKSKPLQSNSPEFYLRQNRLRAASARVTSNERENSVEDLETAERIIFRPLFRYRQIVAEREKRHKERQEIRRMEFCKKYFYKCWPQFKDRYDTYNNQYYLYSNQASNENNYLYNNYPYYYYRPTPC